MTTTEITEKYISERKSLKECLKNGLINYSALSRKIAKELGVEKTSSKEAILIAARRYKQKISTASKEDIILKTFKKSNIEIKNNILVYTLEKNIYPETLIDFEKVVKKERSIFFSIEGTKSITIILQKQNSDEFEHRFRNFAFIKKENLSLIKITTPRIAEIPGIINHITSQFYEKGVNIEEFMSCDEDTLIVIKTKDAEKVFSMFSF